MPIACGVDCALSLNIFLLKRFFSLSLFLLLDEPQPRKTNGEDHHHDQNGVLNHRSDPELMLTDQRRPKRKSRPKALSSGSIRRSVELLWSTCAGNDAVLLIQINTCPGENASVVCPGELAPIHLRSAWMRRLWGRMAAASAHRSRPGSCCATACGTGHYTPRGCGALNAPGAILPPCGRSTPRRVAGCGRVPAVGAGC